MFPSSPLPRGTRARKLQDLEIFQAVDDRAHDVAAPATLFGEPHRGKLEDPGLCHDRSIPPRPAIGIAGMIARSAYVAIRRAAPG
jgi:hypothetical protein